jgi:hypothetical protein
MLARWLLRVLESTAECSVSIGKKAPLIDRAGKSMAERTDSNRTPRSVLATLTILLLGVAMTWFLVWTELRLQPLEVNWRAFAVFAVLLLICERSPRTWIRFGPIGVVTPLWLFAFALLLLGSPAAGVGVALIGAVLKLAGAGRAPGRWSGRRWHGVVAVERRHDVAGDGRARVDHAGRHGAVGLGRRDRRVRHLDRRTQRRDRSDHASLAPDLVPRIAAPRPQCGSPPKEH